MSFGIRQMTRIHKLLGLVIGLQLLFWTASGLFFTLYPIEKIRGDPFRPSVDHGSLMPDMLAVDAEQATMAAGGSADQATVRPFLGTAVWIVGNGDSKTMVDGVTGRVRSPLVRADIDAIMDRFDSRTPKLGELAAVYQIQENPPREYAGALPVWVAEYEPGKQRIYIDAFTGGIQSVRTTKWRIFDILWRFHIMDITGEDRFNTWWLKLVAFLGLTTVLFGIVLLVDRARKGRLLR